MKKIVSFVVSMVAISALFCLFSSDLVYGKSNDAHVLAKIKSVRVPFVENVGQVDKEVSFYASTFGGTVCVTRNGEIVYSLPKYEDVEDKEALSRRHKEMEKGRHTRKVKGWVLKESFVGADVKEVKGVKRAETVVSYFRGRDPKKWVKGIKSYRGVSFGEVYEGIRLALKARGASVEKVFYLEPGANAEKIMVRVEGAKGLKVNERGALEVKTDLGVVRFTRPLAYQEEGGKRELVEVRYVIKGDGLYGFRVGKYDKKRPLVIDPLLGSTYLGGGDWDRAYALYANGGNVYVAGWTYSTDFPTTVGAYDESFNGGTYDAFVSKLSGDLSTLLASAFLGGGGSEDYIHTLYVDGQGNVYVAGTTASSDFPTTTGAYDESKNGPYYDAFVSKLSGDLSTLLASTFLGGSAWNFSDYANALYVDGQGNVYVAGTTASTDFPTTTGAYDESHNGNGDVFVSKLSGDLSSLLASTFLGGSYIDVANAIDVDGQGNIYVAGYTGSSDFPTTTGAHDESYNGGDYDAFVSKLSGDLSTLLASTFLGGGDYDVAPTLDADGQGNVYVAGYTASSDFPTTTGAYDESYNGGDYADAFVSKLSGDLSNLLASTFLGGGSGDAANALHLDGQGNVYVTGVAQSTDFPTTTGAYDESHNGNGDVFVSKLSGDLSTLLASTFLGGGDLDKTYALCVDGQGNVYVAGETKSSDFPTASFDESFNGGYDVFVSKLSGDLSSGGASTHSLTVQKFGSGSGRVVSSPAGIDCGADCTETYIEGSTVTLTATADPGSVFEGWRGGGCYGTGVCTVVMDSDVVVTAVFSATGEVSVIPEGYDFGAVTTGETRVKGFKVVNSGTISITIDSISLTGSDASDFSIKNDTCSGGGNTLSSGQSCTFEVEFAPQQAGAKTAYVNIIGNFSTITAYLYGTATEPQTSEVYGVVYDETGRGLSGAVVEVGDYSDTTDSSGTYSISGIPVGEYTMRVSKAGYVTVSRSISLSSGVRMRQDFTLRAESVEDVEIVNISTQYNGFVYILTGQDFYVDVTVTVDWGGHEPGYVRFITPKNTYDVQVAGNEKITTVSRSFNVSDEFGVCDVLKVEAVSADGAKADAVAPFTVMRDVQGVNVPLDLTETGGGFYLKSKFGLNWNLINEGIDDGVIPDKIPVFGGKGVKLSYIPTVSLKYSSSGVVGFGLEWEGLQREVKFGIAGVELKLNPQLNIEGEFQYPGCFYRWDGIVGVSGEAGIKRRWPFVFMAGPVPVPMYAKTSVKLSADADLRVMNLDDINNVGLNGEISFKPYVRGSLGAGFDEKFAVEGWIGGGLDYTLQYPEEPTLKGITLYLNGGVKIYALLWTWENEMLKWDWDLYSSQSGALSAEALQVSPRLLSRDYMQRGEYGVFSGGSVESINRMVNEAGVGYTTRLAEIQSNVFPYSEPSISASGGNMYLVWLYDNPTRSDMNRTELVFSRYEGGVWSSPVAVEDDGTADFHPSLRVFSDGSAVVAFEDEGVVHPDDATFDDMKARLEISVGRYDPQTETWTVQRLTTNGYLDRSPKVAGSSADDVIVVWIANEDNDIRGGAGSPNRIYWSKWQGKGWSQPEMVAEVGYGLIKYDVWYDGQKGYIVMSLDMDGDGSTVDDWELWRISYSNGSWGQAERLTNDEVVDGNPKMAYSDGSLLLVWMKGGELSGVKDFNFTGRQVIYSDEVGYSTNLGDFRLFQSDSGKAAIVWAEASEYSSDIYVVFYDPVFGVWGAPKQLTVDTETERHLTGTFYGDSSIVVVYDRNVMGTEKVQRADATGVMRQIEVPVQISTDLYRLEYEMGEDLAIGGVEVEPENPAPGATVVLKARAINAGDTGMEDVEVGFYNGDPGAGGEEIGRVRIDRVLAPGDEEEVSLQWTVPMDVSSPLRIYAVIDPDGVKDPTNRDNNTAWVDTVMPDLWIKELGWERTGNGKVKITARVENQGVVDAAGVEVVFRDGNGGLMYNGVIGDVKAGEVVDVSYEMDMSKTVEQKTRVRVVVDEANRVKEYKEDNNEADVLVTKREDLFSDVPEGYWARDYIYRIYLYGITSGCSLDDISTPENEAKYCPDDPVTRAQMAVFILKALGEQPSATCTGSVFSDVNAQTVGEGFCKYIEKFSELGITAGCRADDPGTPQNEAMYCPNDEITRAQMAVFITRALGHQPAASCTGTVFDDVDAGSVGEGFCRYIEKFSELGITAGCSSNPPLYCPYSSVTRAQMAVFLTKGFLQ